MTSANLVTFLGAFCFTFLTWRPHMSPTQEVLYVVLGSVFGVVCYLLYAWWKEQQ